jgi:hypothetical protein
MPDARQILATHRRGPQIDADILVACIDACFDCAQSCTACADADLAEPDIDTLRACITLCLNCSDVCAATGRVLTRQTEFVPELVLAMVQACAAACRLCGDECDRHAHHHEHCRICEGVCRRCEQACNEVLTALR